ncbi:MAG: hypothetical protein VKO21_10285 [Candidatus Sericytochromatia bacterium]|nr:hypothetical protein [Candidatus Sericytochromatia bacterium]
MTRGKWLPWAFVMAAEGAAVIAGVPGRAEEFAGIEVVVPAPEIWRGGRVDLEFRTWRWMPGEDPRGALPSRQEAAAPVSPPTVVRVSAGEALNDLRGWRVPAAVGWLRLDFMVERAGLGQDTSLVLRGIAADVEVYVNGQRLHRARGPVDHPWARVMRVPIPGSLLKATGNVLALRLEAWPGHPWLGCVGFKAWFTALRPPKPPAPEPPPAWVWEPARPAGIPPLEPGVGRFGTGPAARLSSCRLSVDGWEPLEEAGGTGWTGRFEAHGQPLATSARVIVQGTTGRVFERHSPSGRRLWRLHAPVMAPGFVLEGGEATVSVRIPKVRSLTWTDRWGVVTRPCRDLLPRLVQPSGNWLLLSGIDTQVPLVLASDRLPFAGRLARETDDTLALTVGPGEDLRVLWPEGPVALARGESNHEGPDRERVARARFWAAAALPWGLRTRVSGYAADGWIKLEDHWTHLPWGTVPVAILSPALGLRALPTAGRPQVRTDAADLGVTTYEGPLRGRIGETLAYEVPSPRRLPVRRLPVTGRAPTLEPGGAGLLDAAAEDALALPDLDPAGRSKPRTPTLEALARVWRERAWGTLDIPPLDRGLRWIMAWLDPAGLPTDAILATGPVLDRTSRLAESSVLARMGLAPQVKEVAEGLRRALDPLSLVVPPSPGGPRHLTAGHGVATWLGALAAWRLADRREEPEWKAIAARLGPVAADPEARQRWRSGLGLQDPTPLPPERERAEIQQAKGWKLPVPRPAEADWLQHPDRLHGLLGDTNVEAIVLEARGLEVLAGRHDPGQKRLILSLRASGRGDRTVTLVLPRGATSLEAEVDGLPAGTSCLIEGGPGSRKLLRMRGLPTVPVMLRFRYA